MPNPARPQYQEIIESTWGLAVADTVVRRYASSAERDGDLAGFTPAELAGQVVAVAGVAEVHNGTHWMPLLSAPFGNPGIGIHAASYVGTTNAFGGLIISFPNAPFPAGVLIAFVAMVGDTGAGFVMTQAASTVAWQASCVVYSQAGNGAIVANGAVRINYIALGY